MRQTRKPPQNPAFRPSYLLAAAVIWAVAIASLAAGPPPADLQVARVECPAR